MNNKLNLSLSLVLGILFSVLFLWKIPGISSIIFFIVVIGVAFLLMSTKKSKTDLNKLGFAILPFVVLLALTPFLRADLTARIMSALVLMFVQSIFLAVVFVPSSLTNFGLVQIAALPLKLSVSWIPDAFESIKDLLAKKETKKNPYMKKIVAGVLISVPILLVVLALLSAADAVFAKYVEDILQSTLGVVFRDFWSFVSFSFKVMVSLFVTLYFVGLNWGLLNENSSLQKWLRQDKKDKEFVRNWDMIVSSTVLVLLNIVLALFVVVQFKYLFGGQQNILKVDSNLTYAQYARKGFFELIVVSGFVYLIQLFVNGKVYLSSVKTKVLFFANSVLLSLLVLVITYSADRRLSLYEDIYGYTSLRLFVHYVIYMVAILFVLLMASNFMKNIKAFTSKLLAASFLLTIFLNLVFPFDYVTSKLNVQRYKETGNIDYGYMFSLSNEALPNMLSLYKSVDNSFEKDMLRSELQSRLASLNDEDKKWQEFNLYNYLYRKTLKNEIKKYEFTKGISDELNTFLNGYKATLMKGDYETAYNKYWSKSTSKSDFINDAKKYNLHIYQINYEMPVGVNNIDKWRENPYLSRKLYMKIRYSAMYGYNSQFINAPSMVSYQGNYREIKVTIENNEIKIISDYTFQLGENMSNYGTSYYRGDTYTK